MYWNDLQIQTYCSHIYVQILYSLSKSKEKKNNKKKHRKPEHKIPLDSDLKGM